MAADILSRRRRSNRMRRRGAVTVLAAILSIVIVGMVALCVDVGYLLSMKEELQRTADATALATIWDYGKHRSDGENTAMSEQLARLTAQQFAYANDIGNHGPQINANSGNSASGDLVFGYVNDFYNSSATFDISTPAAYNAVKVRVRRDGSLNGEAPLFFARIFGLTGQALYADAKAGLVRDVRGFQIPHDGSNIGILPFALDLDTWNLWEAQLTEDNWTWNETDGTVEPGPDGKMEMNLYPQGTGAPGNRGTVDIGSNGNSSSDIARQIVDGLSPSDMQHHGGSLQFDASGKLYLNGDTGISAGFKDELNSVVGEPRTIPIFEEVNGPGNNAEYTIVKWMGIRILHVDLSGAMSNKHVIIQAAPVVGPGIIPSTETGTSDYVFSSAVLLE